MTAKFAIAGSGFGLYGYLPALITSISNRILLPTAYKEKLLARKELRPYLNNVEWHDDFDTIIKNTTGLVIAKNPETQVEIVTKILLSKNKVNLFLEKPIAPNVESAQQLLSALISSKIKFRIGYTFLATSWYPSLKKSFSTATDKKISIIWKFRAHHFAHDLDNWKRYKDQGGGVIRFYGVHVIALLAALGFDQVLSSQTLQQQYIDEQWHAIFRSSISQQECEVFIDSCSDENAFCIAMNKNKIVDSSDPFDEEITGLIDRRVRVLEKHCKTLLEDDEYYYELYLKTNQLWYHVEQINKE